MARTVLKDKADDIIKIIKEPLKKTKKKKNRRKKKNSIAVSFY